MDFYNEMASPLTAGADIQIDTTGNIFLVDGADRTRQRIIRRLLTNPGEYIWSPLYGAGIKKEVGKLLTDDEKKRLVAVCLEQVRQENTVASFPPPEITISQPGYGQLSIKIKYTENQTNVSRVININIKK